MSSPRAFGFGFRALKNFPELIPLASIIGTACVGALGFIGYSLITKPDVIINKTVDTPPWERIEPTESRKMRVVNKDVYRVNPELQKLREEIGSYRR